uniref:Uncharacterized protein n=1 Tax=Pipistrellus kuhlii TaxID=59472 RepID=A0A7J7QYC7_PIPKU|nr:hypothetical protein mPipKuh1_008123 [Pipistrellus kuhlii]
MQIRRTKMATAQVLQPRCSRQSGRAGGQDACYEREGGARDLRSGTPARAKAWVREPEGNRCRKPREEGLLQGSLHARASSYNDDDDDDERASRTGRSGALGTHADQRPLLGCRPHGEQEEREEEAARTRAGAVQRPSRPIDGAGRWVGFHRFRSSDRAVLGPGAGGRRLSRPGRQPGPRGVLCRVSTEARQAGVRGSGPGPAAESRAGTETRQR